jgi:hypothetical protein
MSESAHTAMPRPLQTGLVPALDVARQAGPLAAPNGVLYAQFGDTGIDAPDLLRLVQAVPATIAPALAGNIYYFVPLAIIEARPSEASGHRSGHEETLIAAAHTADLADQAICHRNVELGSLARELRALLPEPDAGVTPRTVPDEGVFISTRLLSDRFSLSFEFFINVGHAFVDHAGVPAAFSELAWSQAIADIRGETSQDAWESRALALGTALPPTSPTAYDGRPRIDEKAKTSFLEAAFADALAIYLLSLSVDFDYSELREREYPLLAPNALAERLRLTARLFPPNPTYDFAIRYRRRA